MRDPHRLCLAASLLSCNADRGENKTEGLQYQKAIVVSRKTHKAVSRVPCLVKSSW